MTIAASGPIAMATVAAELNISAAGLSLNDSRVRGLTGTLSGAVTLSSARGKTRITVTPGYVNSGGGNGYTGYKPDLGSGGSVSPASYGGYTIYEMSTALGAFNSLTFRLVTTSVPQSFFTFIVVNGQKFLSAAATFSVVGGYTFWTWGRPYTEFTNGVPANIYLG